MRIGLSVLSIPIVFLFTFAASLCAERPARQPTTRPLTESQIERQKWESRIIFFGDEGTGEWSLRVRDQDVDGQKQFTLREVWTYDTSEKRWVKMGTTQIHATMVPANQKIRDPNNLEPEDNQILAMLPIEKDQYGLFYAKWSVDGVKGSTYMQVGPGLRDRNIPIMHQKPPEGKILAIVPFDLKHSEAMFIPDPRKACELGE
jgi:hypothetical protein